jgi:hypothetical protein
MPVGEGHVRRVNQFMRQNSRSPSGIELTVTVTPALCARAMFRRVLSRRPVNSASVPGVRSSTCP